MEMCYDGVLVMPSSYAIMDEEEMMYVDGGLAIPNWMLAGFVNLAIDCIVAGGLKAAAGYFRSQAKKYGEKTAAFFMSETLRKRLIAKGVGASIAAGICDVAIIGFTIWCWATDPGGQLVRYHDGRDSNPNNGWCDF